MNKICFLPRTFIKNEAPASLEKQGPHFQLLIVSPVHPLIFLIGI